MNEVMVYIAREVAARHGVLAGGLRSRVRTRRYCHARDETWAVIHATGRFSTTQIGRAFNRDHSSVSVGIRRHKERAAQ